MKRKEVTVNWEYIPLAVALFSAVIVIASIIQLIMGYEGSNLWLGTGALVSLGGAGLGANVVEDWGKRTYSIPIPGKALPVIDVHKRTPAAFPPKTSQCYVCGVIDPERVESFGTAVHPECTEWLGDWKIPRWEIKRSSYGSITLHTMDGLKTGEEVRDYCNQFLSGWLESGDLIATLGGGPDGRSLRIPKAKKHVEPETVAHTGWKIVVAATGKLIDTLPATNTPDEVNAYCRARFNSLAPGEMTAYRPTDLGPPGSMEFLDILPAPVVMNTASGKVEISFTGSGKTARQIQLEKLRVELEEQRAELEKFTALLQSRARRIT